jgi:hypothetical protein
LLHLHIHHEARLKKVVNVRTLDYPKVFESPAKCANYTSFPKTKTAITTMLLIVLAFSIVTPTLMMHPASSSKASTTTSSGDGDYKQIDIFGGAFSNQSISVALNQIVDVSFSICPMIDVPNTTVRFFLPSDVIKVVKGDLLWTGDVKEGQTITLQLSIMLESDVFVGIRALVTAPSYYSSSYYMSVSTTATTGPSAPKGHLPATNVNLSPTPSAPASEPLPLHRLLGNSSTSGVNVTNPGYVYTFYGYWYFYSDEAGYDIPMDNFYCELWDRHWYGDELVAYFWTDNNGYYSISVDRGGESSMSPYVLAYAQDGWFSYTVDGSGWEYRWIVSLPDSTPPGSYNVGSWAAEDCYQACQAVHGVEAEGAFVYWNTWGNYMRDWVTIHWPSGSWPCSDGNNLYLPSSWGWGHVTVQHEYGHCIMYALYGGWPPTSHGGESHYIFDEKDGGFAIIEGWAEFSQCVVDNNPANLADWYNGHGGNIETNDWYNCIDTGDMDGNIVEGSCASILWDIWDPVNSAERDYLSMGYAPIFSILQNYKPGDMISFWWDWYAVYTDTPTRGYLSNIYWNYGIDEDWFGPWGSITINSGATYTNSRWVTLTLDGQDYGSGVYYMRFANDYPTLTWSSWYSYATTFSYYMNNPNDGSKSVDVQYADADWHVTGAGTIYDYITLDTTPPTGSITINSGATYTTSRTVTLTLSASDATSGVAKMRFSENMGSWGSWYTYATTFSYTLTSSGDGYKSIDVQYQDNAGNPTTAWTIWDSIYLDTTPPTGSIIINNGNPTYTNTLSVTLYLTYSDTTSGVSKVRYGNWGLAWTAWEDPAATRAWTLDSTGGDGYKRVYYQIIDKAGLYSNQFYDDIYLDTTPPITTISHSPGNSSVSLSATDATSGVSATYYKIDAGSWTTYTGTFALTGTGTHTISYYSKDNVGNVEATKTLVVYYLNVNTDPTGITTISGTGWYDKDTTATTGKAPATVSSGGNLYTFSTWKEDGTAMAGNPINVLMNTTHTATAFYVKFDFNVSVAPFTKTVVAGASFSSVFNVTATLVSGTTQSISWSASGLPSGATYSFSPTSGHPTFLSKLSITANSTTLPGAYSVTITGTGPGGSHSKTVTLCVLNFTVSSSSISPNEDGVRENTTVRATFWESHAWTLTVKNSSGIIVRHLGTGTSLSLEVLWDGKDDSGKVVKDGTYRVFLTWTSFVFARQVIVDTKSPVVTCSWSPNPFNPHTGQNSTLTYSISERCAVAIKIYNSNGTLVKTLQLSTTYDAGNYTILWDGKNNSGTVVSA